MTNINEIFAQLEYLNTTKEQIKEALINKGQSISDTDTFRSYVDKINAILTNSNIWEITSKVVAKDNIAVGDNISLSSSDYTELENGTENDYFVANFSDNQNAKYWLGIAKLLHIINTNYVLEVVYLGANTFGTATSGDILEDKTAWVNGNPVTGTLPVSDELNPQSVTSVYSSDTALILRNSLTTPICIRPSGGLSAANDIVVNAIRLTPDILKEGSTILGVEGTLKIGVDTSDGTAVADEIALNKVAYVKGERIVGTLPEHSNVSVLTADSVTYSVDGIQSTAYGTRKEIVTTTSQILINTTNEQIVSATKLTADKIKQNTTLFGVTGTLEPIPTNTSKITSGNSSVLSSNNAITAGSSSIQVTHNQSSGNILLYSGASLGLTVANTTVANVIGLTEDIIKKDTTILGVTGTYIGEAGTGTEDATAEATDIISGKTAYVNKLKVEGTLPLLSGTIYKPTIDTVTYNEVTGGANTFTITTQNVNVKYANGVALKNSTISLTLSQSQIASLIGLTEDMIAEGVTVLGIKGTHTGTGMLTEEEYNECEALANQILAITE